MATPERMQQKVQNAIAYTNGAGYKEDYSHVFEYAPEHAQIAAMAEVSKAMRRFGGTMPSEGPQAFDFAEALLHKAESMKPGIHRELLTAHAHNVLRRAVGTNETE